MPGTKCFTQIILFLLLSFLLFSLENYLERLNKLFKVTQLVMAQGRQGQGGVIAELLHGTMLPPRFSWALRGWHAESIQITPM